VETDDRHVDLIRRLRVTEPAPEQMRRVDRVIHDGVMDADQVVFDAATGTVTIPFAQEPDNFEDLPGPPLERPVLRRTTWRYREYRVPLYRAVLLLRRVRSFDMGTTGEAWGYLTQLKWEPWLSRIRIPLGARDDAVAVVESFDLEVRLTAGRAGSIRRRIGRFTAIETDRWR
jgi:hypothetical protein